MNMTFATLEHLFEYLKVEKFDSIDVQADFDYFSPRHILFNDRERASQIEGVCDHFISMMGDPRWKEIDEYVVYATRYAEKWTIHISLSSPGYREFANKMFSGHYGSLD